MQSGEMRKRKKLPVTLRFTFWTVVVVAGLAVYLVAKLFAHDDLLRPLVRLVWGA
jgi:hypothetical protein